MRCIKPIAHESVQISVSYTHLSDRPFLEPCDDRKNSSTDSPSLKFDLIGISTVLPVDDALSLIHI